MVKKSVIQQIEELVSKAKPEDLSSIQTLQKIKADLEQRALAEEKSKQDKLCELWKLWGMTSDEAGTWEDFCLVFLRRRGYKTISKRKLGGGRRKNVQAAPVTSEVIERAKKMYQQSQWKGNVWALAKELKVNTNTLKKHLGIAKSKRMGSSLV